MAVALTQADVLDVNIRIPKIDFKRMKGIAKAMGWDIFQTESHTAAEIQAAQEAYVAETLTRAYMELDESKLSSQEVATLDDFLKEL